MAQLGAAGIQIAPLGYAGDPQLVWPQGGWPYRKPFTVITAHWYAVLHFEVYTSYVDYYTPLADVIVNGTIIGQVPPTPELRPVSYRFSTGLLGPYTNGYNGTFYWELRPKGDTYLIAGNWRVEYNKIIL